MTCLLLCCCMCLQENAERYASLLQQARTMDHSDVFRREIIFLAGALAVCRV